MHRHSRMFPFVFGIAIGVLCTIFLPKYVRPYLPDLLIGKESVVKGTVMSKEKKGDALLLAVDTSQGALLATFTKKGDEVNLLVGEKDVIEFTLESYKPFIDDPKITRVIKAQQTSSPELEKASAPPDEPAVMSTKEVKRSPGKPVSARPASKSASPDVQHQLRGSEVPGDKGSEK